MFEIFSIPFMQRALLAGAILAVLLATLGVIATVRKMAFFGEGIAHASLAGIAIAVMVGASPLPFAIGWAIIVALSIYALERYTTLSSDTLIGILFTASMAIGVIIMSLTPGYQPELISFLFGSILTINSLDVFLIAVLGTIILTWQFTNMRSLTYLSLSPESASVHGIKVQLQSIIFYVALAIATVLGVKILGIVLVSALIILPAATAKMLAKSFKHYLTLSIIISEITIISGLFLSYIWDLPSGAVIVLTGTTMFLLATMFRELKR